MNLAALRRLRQKLQSNRPVYGIWVTLNAASVTEMAVVCGMDWVVIDAEHGQLDWGDITEHLRAVSRSQTVALVRVAELNGGLIKRALDLGADGVVVPWIETADQLRECVRYSKYPPEGVRGIGAERATGWGSRLAEYVAHANENVLIVPIIETVEAGRNLGEMLAVPGVDLFYFGPADYSSTAGFAGSWEGPGVAAELLRLKDQVRSREKHCGVVGLDREDVHRRCEQGFRMIGLGMDSGILLKGMQNMLSGVQQTEPSESKSAPGSSESLP